MYKILNRNIGCYFFYFVGLLFFYFFLLFCHANLRAIRVLFPVFYMSCKGMHGRFLKETEVKRLKSPFGYHNERVSTYTVVLVHRIFH